MWLGWPSSVVEKFIEHKTDFNVNIDELSWIVSTMDLGNVISPLFAGYLMDKIGRKMSTVVLGPLFMITWLLAIYVPTSWALYTARLLAGMGKGMSYTVVPVFLGEIAGVHIRGALSSVFCLQLHMGFLFEAVIGPLVTYRTLNMVSAVVPVLFILTVVWIPESPYYLLKRKRPVEADKCLRWFRSANDDVQDELHKMEINVEKDMENQSTFRQLFSSRKDLRALAIVVTACISQRAGGISCILAYSVLILPEPSPIMSKFGYIMLFATIMVIVNFVSVALVDKIGRRPMLVFSEVSMGVITTVFAVYFYLKRLGVDVSMFTWLPYLCHVSFAVVFAIGVGFIPVVYLGELFPVNIRSHCSAIASTTLAFCSFVTNKMFLLVSQRYGYHTMFCLFAVVNFAGAAYSYKYAVETKGKTFQEIQELLEDAVNGNNKTKDNNRNSI